MKWIGILFLLSSMAYGYERTQVHMGTLITVKSSDEESIDRVFELFYDLDKRLSTYKEDSEISRLNRTGSLELSESTREVLERSREISLLTEGVFDVTIGSLSHDTYRFGRDEKLPKRSELQQAVQKIGSEKLTLEGNQALLSSGSIIDLGGIGKGYAVDRSIRLLQERDIKQAIVAASGDIGCIGECNVAITDPFKPQSIYKTLHSSWNRFAISTSGNYERYIKNKTHNHLLNPKTGQSQQLYASVTLYGSGDNTKLDALATAIAIMPLKKGLKLLKEQNIGYVLILNNGQIYESPLPKGISRVN